MRYIWQHIQIITSTYKGAIPLAHYLKNHFKQHPKLGSRDRKIICEMCYSWYRCEKGIIGNLLLEEKIALCLYLCGSQSKYILPYLPTPLQDVTLLVSERIYANMDSFYLNAIFPHDTLMSEGINVTEWLQSMLTQPALFIRIRKNRDKLLAILKENDIAFTQIDEDALMLPNGAQIDKLLLPDSYVVQDLSSQRTGTYFCPQKEAQWLDCCAGAGGKSLLLKDIEDTIKLTVTDRRDSILHNLAQRFKLYHYPQPATHVVDVHNALQLKAILGQKCFDGIICDVPCTGSGTWARTPEQLYFFNPAKLNEISTLQATIAANASAYIKPGGRFIYITCSIFRQENEGVIAQLIKNNTHLTLEEMHLINGINDHADSMFVAVLKRN
jgi:16S rRNA (cytosine967-C5)-methyltransferase